MLRYIDIARWPELAERQLFKPLSEDYHQPSNRKFSFDYLVKKDPISGRPSDGPWLNKYYADVVESLEEKANSFLIRRQDEIMLKDIHKQAKLGENYILKLHLRSQLPIRNDHFTGRKKDVEKLLSKLKENRTVSVTGVNGMGGVGKTALTIEVCHSIKKTWTEEKSFFKDGILWIRLEKTHTLEVVSEMIATQTGFLVMSSTLNEKYQEIVKYLKSYEILIVIDSAEQNLDILHNLIRFFEDFPLLVTSRKIIPEILDTIDVNVLDKEDARNLFAGHFDSVTSEEKQTIDDICKEVGYLPLAIKILASLTIVNRKKKTIVQILNDYLEEKEKRLARLKTNPKNQSQEEEKNANAIYCFSLSYDDLKEHSKNILMRAGMFEHPFSMERINDFFEGEDISNEIDELVELSLIDKDLEKNKYSLHPLIKEFALMNASRVGIIDEKYEKRKIIFLKQIEIGNYSDLDEIIAVCYEAYEKEDAEYFHKYSGYLDAFLDKEGLWEKKIMLNQLGLKLSEKSIKKKKINKDEKTKNEQLFTEYLISIADTLGRQGKYKEAIEKYSEALKKTKNLFISYSILNYEFNLRNYEKSYLGNLKKIRESSIVRDYENLGRFSKNIGHIYGEFGYNKKAFQCAKVNLSHKKWEEHYQKINTLRAIEDLTDLYEKKGSYSKALSLYIKLFNLSKSLGSQELKAIFISKLITTHIKLNNLEQAAAYYEQFKLAIFKMGNVSDDIEILGGHLKFAEKKYEDALHHFSRIKQKEIRNYWMGKTFIETHQLSEAKSYINSLLKLYKKKKNPLGLANVLSIKSRLLLKQGHIYKAIINLSKTIKTKKELDIIDLTYENETKNDIITILKNKGLEIDFYKDLAKNGKYTKIKPDFIISKLPKSINTSGDRKEMLLIPKGICFIGEGKIKEFDIDTLSKNIDEVTGQFQLPDYTKDGTLSIDKHFIKLPDNPNVVCDGDRFLTSLENSISLTKEEKLRITEAFPRLDQEQINELIKIFDEEKIKFSELEYEYSQDVNELRKRRYIELYGIGIKDSAKQIYLYSYYMDKHPVSVIEYKQFCDTISYSYPEYWNEEILSKYGDSPVVNISFEDANTYAKWAGKLLPTADEWEKACRGEQGKVYSWGEKWNQSKTKCHFDSEIREIHKKRKKKKNQERQQIVDELKDKDKKYKFKIPLHPNTTFDDNYFAYLLENSVSLNDDEKNKVVESIERLDQNQIDQLIKIFEEEKQKFLELENEFQEGEVEEYENDHEDDFQQISELFQQFLNLTVTNSSDFNIQDMVGNVQEWTCSMEQNNYVIKGGGWLSPNPEEDCKSFKHQLIEGKSKRFDVGFRCVKPIFTKMDLENLTK